LNKKGHATVLVTKDSITANTRMMLQFLVGMLGMYLLLVGNLLVLNGTMLAICFIGKFK